MVYMIIIKSHLEPNIQNPLVTLAILFVSLPNLTATNSPLRH